MSALALLATGAVLVLGYCLGITWAVSGSGRKGRS